MSETTKTRIVIMDENDTIVGYKERDSLEKTDIYRVTALWITNSKGDILLAQRHYTKRQHSLMRGPAVAGTVDEGESYADNIVKEADEELGFKEI